MKKSRFTETRIVSILKKHVAGIKTSDLCREHGISEQTFYTWQAKYGGLTVKELKRMKELEAENAHLIKIYADINLDGYALNGSKNNWLTLKLIK
jgi:putative transposase